MGTNRFYPEEVKREVIRLKLEGQTSNQELMKQFGIKNESQIKTWVQWYKQGAFHRLAQPPGSQYTSRAFQQAAKEKGIITSMSRKGNCFDNAMIESFHSSLKSEEFSIRVRMPLPSSIIVEKVDSYMYYYNYIRPFTKLNDHSPVEFRTAAA